MMSDQQLVVKSYTWYIETMNATMEDNDQYVGYHDWLKKEYGAYITYVESRFDYKLHFDCEENRVKFMVAWA